MNDRKTDEMNTTEASRNEPRSRPMGERPMFQGMIHRVAVLFAVLVIGWTGSACGGEALAEVPLANVHASPEALVRAVLDALEAEDQEALRGFLVSRDEYESALWPEMPDEEYTPFEFFWGMVAAGQRKGLNQLIDRYGGLELEVVSITIPEDESTKESYESFSFHKQVEVTVRRVDTGQEGELPSFDVFLEYEGAWKLANYDEL